MLSRGTYLAVLVVLLGMGCSPPVLAQSYRIKEGVSLGYQNMRTGPGQGHGIVAQIPAGTGGIQAAGGCKDPDDGKSRFRWCKYSWKGLTGWMSINGLEPVAAGGGASGAPPSATRPGGGTAGQQKLLQCVCGPWYYKICLNPQMSEDGPFPIRDGIQFRGHRGFASALNGGEGRPCTIPAP